MWTTSLFALAVTQLPLADDPTPTLVFGDLDADGRPDAVVVDPYGPTRVLRNGGESGFVDVTDRVGLTGVGSARAALWHDVDADGTLDLLLLQPGGAARLFYNSAEGLFADGTAGSGLELDAGVVGAQWLDVDADGLADLYVSAVDRQRLWKNLGDGSFAELALPVEWTGGVPAGGGGPGSTNAPGPSFTIGSQQNPVPSTQFCSTQIYDQATMGCISASSAPELGKLFPMTTDLHVTTTGNVGIGVASPTTKLHVSGDILSNDEVAAETLRSTAMAGPPMYVKSNVKVTFLNADLLDGLDSSAFSQLGPSIDSSEITDGTITGADVQDGTLTGFDIADGSLSKADYGFNSVDGNALANGVVSNTHVSAVAGIQGSKISPNFGSQDVVTTGSVGIGTTSPSAPLDVRGTTFGQAIVGSTNANGDGEVFFSEVGNDTLGMKLNYDGGTNNFEVRGSVGTTDTMRMRVNRDTGNVHVPGTMSVGTTSVLGAVRADGSTSTYGVYGTTSASISGGVRGHNTTSANGWGVYGTGGAVGVQGQSAAGGSGVLGWSSTTYPSDEAVYGLSDSGVYAVRGLNRVTTNPLTYGVWGEVLSSSGHGVYGRHAATSGTGQGVRGWSNSPSGYGVYSSGDFGGNGAKYFVQPHPQDPSKEIRFVCLEGNESGTYFRGSSTLVGGAATIDVPEEFRLASESDHLTVQVTAVGAPAALWIESKDLDRIVVRGNVDVDFDYFVNGVRRGWANHEPIRDNSAFVPEVRGEPYGNQFPAAYRQILVDNGILNADFTPNEATAAALGWDLAEPGADEERNERLRAAAEAAAQAEAAALAQPAPAPVRD